LRISLKLTPEQLVALTILTDGHPYDVSLEAGPGPGFVTAKLFDADGNVIKTRTWTSAGYVHSSGVRSDDHGWRALARSVMKRVCPWRRIFRA
jgi:hypothetical protein